MLVNYVSDLDMILVDHLISETDQPELASTMVPDGDNEGYKWERGKWVHIDKVFTFKLRDGEAPVEKPVKDNSDGRRPDPKVDEKNKKGTPRKNDNHQLNYDN